MTCDRTKHASKNLLCLTTEAFLYVSIYYGAEICSRYATGGKQPAPCQDISRRVMRDQRKAPQLELLAKIRASQIGVEGACQPATVLLGAPLLVPPENASFP